MDSLLGLLSQLPYDKVAPIIRSIYEEAHPQYLRIQEEAAKEGKVESVAEAEVAESNVTEITKPKSKDAE